MSYSVLFLDEKQSRQQQSTEPDCFKDLNLDQIIHPILASRKDYHLDNFFFTPLGDADTILYRQKVMRDLEDDDIRECFAIFSKSVFELNKYMEQIQKILTSEDNYNKNYLTKGRMLNFADRYCNAISELLTHLSDKNIRSTGLQSLIGYLEHYQKSEEYSAFQIYVKRLRNELSSAKYCMLIKNGTIRVRKYEDQTDLSIDIQELFARFQQGNVQDYRHKLTEEPRAEHVEAAVLNLVATWYPNVFSDLNVFCNKYLYFIDSTIAQFACEIQFYLSWLDYIQPLQKKGLPFCYPQVTTDSEHLYDSDFFDLALASSLGSGQKPVTNDFALDTPERILVVTGPNQGGKTTYARTFGQVHYLASIGLCVPGSAASLFLFNQIYTHFEREEDLSTLNGKLQDDLERLYQILSHATSKSIIVINEIFSSTTLSDALKLGGYMMDSIVKIGCPAICVTFIDELATYSKETVSMMSTVKEDDPTTRSFKIVRKPPNGLAYALHIASKYGLTYGQLNERLKGRS